MGLALTIPLGSDFYVDDERFVVSHIKSPTAFTIKRGADGVEVELFDDGRSRQIAPQVMASVNLGGRRNVAHINLSAPKSIRIATGKNYRDHQARRNSVIGSA